MIKLKSILKEGFAWERKADGSLPTLADTTAAYEAKIANEAQYGSGRKFGKGSPYNDEPDFFRPDQRDTKNIVNTNWDAIVDEYNNKPGFKVETNITPKSYVAKITNTETNNWWEVKFKYNEWSYVCQIGTERKRYDSNTELINNFNEVNGLSESNETAKPDYIDLDKDGDTAETMKSAADDVNESLNELSDDEIDARWNKPHQMWQRGFVTADQKFKEKGSTTKLKDLAPNTNPKLSNFYQEKLSALNAQREQLMFDMEQEAEPEGGPIADYYGEQLEMLDQQINSIKKRMRTNETAKPDYIDLDKDGDTDEPMKSAAKDMNESILITKGGLQALREISLEQRIRKNYIGNK